MTGPPPMAKSLEQWQRFYGTGTMTKDNGGPAFPQADEVMHVDAAGRRYGHSGMSLRDWFAGHIVEVLSSSTHRVDERINGGKVVPVAGLTNAMIAEAAYALADAMLEARKQ